MTINPLFTNMTAAFKYRTVVVLVCCFVASLLQRYVYTMPRITSLMICYNNMAFLRHVHNVWMRISLEIYLKKSHLYTLT